MEDALRYASIAADTLGSERLFIAAVADGIGSLAFSSFSSEYAIVCLFKEAMDLALSEAFAASSLEAKSQVMLDWASGALDSVNSQVKARFENANVGTTLTFAAVFSNAAIVCACGDSPAYLINGSNAELAVELDSVNGVQGQISSYIGCPSAHLKINAAKIRPKAGDLLAIGSDGAFGSLSGAEIAEEAKKSSSYDEALNNILYKASKSTTDNQAIILIDFAETKERGGLFRPWKTSLC
jgi:serine/threonine protein phosphatase PrpC